MALEFTHWLLEYQLLLSGGLVGVIFQLQNLFCEFSRPCRGCIYTERHEPIQRSGVPAGGRVGV